MRRRHAPMQAAPAPANYVATSTANAKSNRRGQARRKAYSFLFKLRVVEFVKTWEAENPGKKTAGSARVTFSTWWIAW